MTDEVRNDLIARLEAVTNGSEELDLEILRVLDIRLGVDAPFISHMPHIQQFTRGIDAALTLLSPGAFWSLLTADAGGFQATVVNDHLAKYVRHNSAAMALCIAALKVRP